MVSRDAAFTSVRITSNEVSERRSDRLLVAITHADEGEPHDTAARSTKVEGERIAHAVRGKDDATRSVDGDPIRLIHCHELICRPEHYVVLVTPPLPRPMLLDIGGVVVQQ